MLTVREFNEAVRGHLHQTLALPIAAWILVFVSAWFVLPQFSARIASGLSWIGPDWLANTLAAFLALILIFVGPASVVLLIDWVRNLRTRPDPRLSCPHCEKWLVRPWGRVVATKHCPRCSREILTDPDRPQPAPLTRKEVEALAARVRRSALVFVGLLVVVSVGTGLGFWAEHLQDAGVLSELPALCVMGAGALAVVAFLVRSIIQDARTPCRLVTCPRCTGRTHPEFVLKFGHCAECSQPLIAEPAGGVASGTLPG